MQKDAMTRLQDAHDDLKACAFRTTLAPEDLPEFVTQLWELADAWTQVCYYNNGGRSEEEQRLFRKFCSWLHDYNSITLRMRNHPYPSGYLLTKAWLPYFEAMLNVTHTYLDTGTMDVFYIPCHQRYAVTGERFQLVTSEMCDFDSPELPWYFPTNIPLVTDEEQMRDYFLNKLMVSKYSFTGDETEYRLSLFEKWKRDLRPVCVWVNEHLVPKSARESGETNWPIRSTKD